MCHLLSSSHWDNDFRHRGESNTNAWMRRGLWRGPWTQHGFPGSGPCTCPTCLGGHMTPEEFPLAAPVHCSLKSSSAASGWEPEERRRQRDTEMSDPAVNPAADAAATSVPGPVLSLPLGLDVLRTSSGALIFSEIVSAPNWLDLALFLWRRGRSGLELCGNWGDATVLGDVRVADAPVSHLSRPAPKAPAPFEIPKILSLFCFVLSLYDFIALFPASLSLDCWFWQHVCRLPCSSSWSAGNSWAFTLEGDT